MGRATIAAAAAVLAVGLGQGCGTDGTTGAADATAGSGGATTTVGSPATEPAVDLTVGDCFDGLVVGAAERARVERVVPSTCAEPHDLEVFHGFEFGGPGDGYPGEDDVVELAERSCAEAFVRRLGQRASLDQVALWPTEASWAQGDRSVLCAAYQSAGGKLVGGLS